MSEEKPEYLNDALEMIGIDLEAPRQIVQEISGFTPLFDVVVQQYKDETRAAVHGAMWRYCQMQDGVCKASLSSIGELLGISPATVMRHAEELCKDGYFIDLTPDLKNRPHVYADTGKVVMKSKIHVSQRNVGISQRNAGISESQLSKDIKKDSKKETTANAVSEIVSSADKKMDAILAFERQGEQAKQNGYWHGQELFPPHLLPYANWWNAKTGQVMKVKPGAWLKEFTRWYDEELTTASLDEAFEHVKSWKKIVEKPADITSTAKAINDSPKPLETIPQREEGRSSGYYA